MLAVSSLFDRAAPWLLRLVWASLPFVAGPAFADALSSRDSLLRTGTSVGLWVVWGLTLAALLVPLDQTLTAVRILVPVAVPAAVIAAFANDAGAGLNALAIGASILATLLVLSAPVGELFINGNSYGEEWRSPLRPPGPVLFGPLPLAWLAVAAGLFLGPLFLLAERWILGGIITALGVVLAPLAVRSIHVLTQRWAVFVPAGVVIHDGFALAEPVLFRRRDIHVLHAAHPETPATDFTSGALGLALEVVLEEPTQVARPVRGQPAEMESIVAFLFSPTRPGKTVETAKARKVKT